MTVQPLAPADYGQAAIGKINVAIGAVNTQAGQIGALQSGAANEATQRQAGDSAATATASALSINPSSRIGDNTGLFTSGLTGLPAARPQLVGGAVAVSPYGNVYRITAAGMVAARKPRWIEPSRIYAMRAAYQRFVTSSDPAGDAVRVAIQWQDASFNPLSQTIVSDALNLTSASGLQVVSCRVPSQAGDAVDIVAPAGAVYWFPFIQTFGSDGVTDFVAIDVQDITDVGAYSPDLTAITARVTSLEGEVAILDPRAAGTPNGLATLDANGAVVQDGTFLAVGTGATPRRYLVKGRDIVNLADYGGGAGASDNGFALLNAFNALGPTGGTIRTGAGKLTFQEQVTLTMPNEAFGLRIVGEGQSASALYWPNANGGILIDCGTDENSIFASDMSFVTGQDGGGSALTMKQGVQLGAPQVNRISNVMFKGDGFDSEFFWTIGADVQGLSNLTTDNCTFKGTASPQGLGISLQGGNVGSGSPSYGIIYNINTCSFFSADTAVLYGDYVQGVVIDGCNITNGRAGITVETGLAAGRAEQLFVISSQIAVTQGHINVPSQVNQIKLIDNLHYVMSNFSAVEISNASLFDISGNTYVAQAGNQSNNNAIVIDNCVANSSGRISANRFLSLFNGILLNAGTSGITVTDDNDYAYLSGGETGPIDFGYQNDIREHYKVYEDSVVVTLDVNAGFQIPLPATAIPCTVAANAASGSTSLVLDSVTNLRVGQPFEFGGAIAYGTTIAGISGTTLTLSAPTIAASSAGDTVTLLNSRFKTIKTVLLTNGAESVTQYSPIVNYASLLPWIVAGQVPGGPAGNLFRINVRVVGT